jgi:hypothetical protein
MNTIKFIVVVSIVLLSADLIANYAINAYGQGQSVEEFNANNPTPDKCIVVKLSNIVIIKPDCGGVEYYSEAINNMLIENFTIKGIDSGAVFMEKIK